MKLILVRHGHSKPNMEGKIVSSTDLGVLPQFGLTSVLTTSTSTAVRSSHACLSRAPRA